MSRIGASEIKDINLGGIRFKSTYLGASKLWNRGSEITYIANGARTIIYVDEGADCLSMVPTKPGHIFKGWALTNSISETPLDSYVADGKPHTFYALWSASDVAINSSGCGNFSTSVFYHTAVDDQKVYYDNVITISDLATLQSRWKYFNIEGSAYVSDGYGTANLYLEQGNLSTHDDKVRRAFSANGSVTSPYSTYLTEAREGYSYFNGAGIYVKDFSVTARTTGTYSGLWFETQLKNDSSYSGYQSACRGFLRSVTLTNNGEISSVG